MGFNLDKLNSVSPKHRERSIDVPELAAFFEENEAPVWVIRSMTSEEVFLCREKAQAATSANIEELIRRLSSGLPKDKVQAVLDAMGVAGDSSAEYVRRINMLRIASVTPKIDHRTAIKIANLNVIVFNRLTDEIYRLTGEGQDLGESIASGTPQE